MSDRELIDLSHTIRPGMTTYPGLPTPIVEDHLSREAAEKIYGPGTTFQIGLVTICTNTGTYLDVPFHRFADGHGLTQLTLERVAGVPGICLDRRGATLIELDEAEPTGLAGHAVIIPRRPLDIVRQPLTCWSRPTSLASGSTRSTSTAPEAATR